MSTESDPYGGRIELGLGSVFHRTRDAVVVGDASSGRIVLWNEGAVETFGYTVEEALGLSLEELVPPDLRARHRTGLARYSEGRPGPVIESGAPVELPALHRDGTVLWVELSLTPLLNDVAGDFVMAIIRNVSERKALEAAVARGRDELSAAVDVLEQGVVLFTLDFEVHVYNAAARRMLGYEPEVLVELFRSGRWVTYREDGSVMPQDERPIARALAGETSTDAVARWRRKDGTTLVLRVTTKLLRDDSDAVAAVVIAFADATTDRAAERARSEHLAELRGLNRELAAEVALREYVLATVAHDMRNPLTGILGFVDLLRRAGANQPEQERQAMLDVIDRQAKALQALTSDLLAVAAVQSERLELARERVPLAAAVRQIAADTESEDPVTIDIAPDAVAFVDPFRLSQILTNLLTNAARYGRPPVTIAANTSGGFVTITVRDHGDGVADEFVDGLFDRFSLAHRSRGGAERGTGLGLAIVRALARAHGGDAWYEDASPNGACFAVRLPVEADDDEPAPSAPAATADLDIDGRVLVVDDDPELLELIRLQLTAAGLVVTTADNATTAFDHARAGGVELIISDVNLAGTDGFELVAQLRAEPTTAHIPVILLTGSAISGEAVARAFDLGASDYLRKPYEPVELIARARAALDGAARNRDLTHLTRSLDDASRTDALTAVLNRRGLDAEIDRLVSAATYTHRDVAALMIDLDHFKAVNDTHGHDSGDQALTATARTIAAQLRAGDIIGRCGGEEFLILLPDTSPGHAADVAERIRATIERTPVQVGNGAHLEITVSVGVAHGDGRRLPEIVTTADQRVYAAKEAGRNRVVTETT